MNRRGVHVQETLDLGIVRQKAGNLREAAELYRQALKLAPANPNALHLAGTVELERGNCERAEELIAKAVRLKPSVAAYHDHLGSVLFRMQRYEEASACYRRALALDPRRADAALNLGAALKELDRLDEAAEQFERALLLNPKAALAHLNLGGVRSAQGRLDEAIEHYRQAVALNPRSAEVHRTLASALFRQNHLDEALEHYQRALAIHPNDAATHSDLGSLLSLQGRGQESLEHFERALALEPTSATVCKNYALALKEFGHIDSALEYYQRALAIDPGCEDACYGIGTTAMDQGNFADAVNYLQKAVSLNPKYAAAYPKLADLKRYQTTDLAEIRNLEGLLDDVNLPPSARSELHFALGKMFDDCELWEQAFTHYQQANDLLHFEFDAGAFQERIAALRETFDAELYRQKSTLGNDSERPVFIVGMPRSGTTLLEQILASHPLVQGAGELREIDLLSQALPQRLGTDEPYPQCVRLLDRERIAELAETYLARLRETAAGDWVRVTDKMPGNFLHLGLIALLFPRARVVHCRRHPLDVCLSCFFQNFNKRVPYSRRLDELGIYYQHYARLMEHWRGVLPLAMLEVDYEEMVTDQEGVSRRLIDFCGLAWDPACLEFHKNRRAVSTASNWQVRQPVYTRAAGHWRNYEKYLGPLLEALGTEAREAIPA